MNANQAKHIDLPDLMSRLGYSPVRSVKGGRELWYASPFRGEKDPSFHTSYLGGKWIWNDFGDTGGTVIDFVMRHENFSNVSDVLRFLDRIYQGHLFDPIPKRVGEGPKKGTNLFSFQQQGGVAADFSDADLGHRDLEFVGTKPLQSPLIFQYLHKRGIDQELAKRYLTLVHYRNTKKQLAKPYFAFGQKNRSGGYEIRSANDSGAKFKSALICRDITIHPGYDSKASHIAVFEGMLDHLSLLKILNAPSLRGDALIMNALSSFDKALSFIKENGYSRVDLFLDNDAPGRTTSLAFTEELGDIVRDQAKTYAPHKDLNDALVSGHSPKFDLTQPSPRP